MIGIQETQQKQWNEFHIANIWGFDDGDFAQSVASGNSGGLLLIWDKKSFTFEYIVEEESFIAAVGKWNGVIGQVGCVNVYGPRGTKERIELWLKMETLCSIEEVKWCIFGDFNEVRGSHERLSSITNFKGVDEFNEFLRRSQLLEISMGGQKFTRVSDNGRKFIRLDRFLATNDFCLLWKNLGVKTLERKWSDHSPIMLYDNRADFGPKSFKLFDAWLNEEGIDRLVKEDWNKEVF